MPITPETCDRLTAGVARIVRSGRQLSARAADTVDGDLPSSGWALPAPPSAPATSIAVPTRVRAGRPSSA